MLSVLVAAVLAAQDEWPTLHKDLQRSGYTADTVKGPYERKWFRDFHDEMIASRVEAIVAGGRCYVGTFAGRLHALNVADGTTTWTFQAGAPIGHSVAFADRRVYVGADDGKLYCLNAETGAKVWDYDAGAGVWVAPAVAAGVVYIGDRAGVVHAVRADGTRAWTFKTGGMILKPASLSEDLQRVVVGSEDMHVYCLTTDGKLLWKSKKLQGLSLRDEAPTIWKGLAVVRTSPADGFHEVMNRNQNLLAKVQAELPVGEKDKFIGDKYANLFRLTPERHQAEQEAVLKYLRENPYDQTFYALKLDDGTEPWLAPVFYTSGLHNPATAPTFDPRTGDGYTYYRTALTNFSRGVRPYTGVGRLDPVTGRVENLWHAQGDQPGWSAFATIGDETQTLSLMGDILLSTHQGTLGGLHPGTRKWHPILNARDTYGGIFGPGALPGSWDGEKKYQRDGYLVNMCNEWHGPDRAIVAIASQRLFWVVGSQVVCIGGPDTPRTATGGTKVPQPWKKKFDFVVTAGGNLTADRVGGFDETIERIPINPNQIRPFLPFPAPGKTPQTSPSCLWEQVSELLRGTWAPFVVELGISKEERHFTQPGETLLILAQAYPYLSTKLQAQAAPYMAGLFDAGFPADAPGARRELYDLGPGMTKFAAQPFAFARIDAYAASTWAQATGSWDKVLAREAEYREAFDELQPARIDPKAKDAGAKANVQIAAALGYARIAQKAGKPDEVERALAVLAELVTERVHHERADSNFVREVRGAHSGSIPRYHDLVPELAAMLHAFCPRELDRNVRALTTQLPVWYQAFAERMAGGENYTHTPLLARGLFAALADGVQAPSAELASRLDQPWCRADLYFIEKLSAVQRAAAAGR
ncbi:MAG TPA: PQQ-binding-like beta-propeller repeat protein [Planctomycetota bacterium]|nr:PQQ-binding-like beta-propeller repeat protein [Planctomycetota bacterium]